MNDFFAISLLLIPAQKENYAGGLPTSPKQLLKATVDVDSSLVTWPT